MFRQAGSLRPLAGARGRAHIRNLLQHVHLSQSWERKIVPRRDVASVPPDFISLMTHVQ